MAADTITTQRGQTLAIPITLFEDEGETPIDLTSAEVTVREAHPSVLIEASISIVDAAGGEVLLETTEEQSDQLGTGRINWFRIEAQFGDGSNRVTPKLWIKVE